MASKINKNYDFKINTTKLEEELIKNLGGFEDGEGITDEGNDKKLPWLVAKDGYLFKIEEDGEVIRIEGIALNPSNVILSTSGDKTTQEIGITLTEKAKGKTVTWENPDTAGSIIEFEEGTEKVKVTAKGVGEVELTAKVDGTDYSATCTVKVVQQITKVEFKAPHIGVDKNGTATLEATKYQEENEVTENAESLVYTSNNPDIVTVDKNTGKVTGKKVGIAKITVSGSVSTEVTAECEVIVVNPVVPSKPVLQDEMQAVIYNKTTGMPETPANTNNAWYNYAEKRWANAQTTGDGSFWVWIPRYEYIIRDETIYVSFIDKNKTTATDGFKIHPAFQDGRNKEIPFGNGEWRDDISGIWVAKYEMSQEKWLYNEEDGKYEWTPQTTESASDGNQEITADDKTTLRAVSKPGVTSWRFIQIGNSFANSLIYAKNLGLSNVDSHMMKNSEWGAVAYLTHSKYGRNGEEVEQNTNTSYYTGGKENTTPINEDCLAQSSTKNETGIFDLSGGTLERMAGYISDGSKYLKNGLTTTVESFVKTEYSTEGYKNLSTEYVTVYPYFSNDKSTANYDAYKTAATSSNGKYGYGDAILETSTSGSGTTSWPRGTEDYSAFPYVDYPFFVRGYENDLNKGAGVFAFNHYTGAANINNSFRVVLVAE